MTLRQKLDLFACVRPVVWFEGVPSPVRNPGEVDMVILERIMKIFTQGSSIKQGQMK